MRAAATGQLKQRVGDAAQARQCELQTIAWHQCRCGSCQSHDYIRVPKPSQRGQRETPHVAGSAPQTGALSLRGPVCGALSVGPCLQGPVYGALSGGQTGPVPRHHREGRERQKLPAAQGLNQGLAGGVTGYIRVKIRVMVVSESRSFPSLGPSVKSSSGVRSGGTCAPTRAAAGPGWQSGSGVDAQSDQSIGPRLIGGAAEWFREYTRAPPVNRTDPSRRKLVGYYSYAACPQSLALDSDIFPGLPPVLPDGFIAPPPPSSLS